MRFHIHVWKKEPFTNGRIKKTCRICGAVRIIKGKKNGGK